LRLIHPLTGAEYVFISDSAGGRIAIGQLKEQIRNIRFAQPNAVPLVKLGSAPFKTRYGVKERPNFEVVEWRNKGSDQAQQQLAEDRDENAFGVPFDDDIPWK
jgi:hypothetical protein